MGSRPGSVFKTIAIIIAAILAVPVALYFLWWVVVVVVMLFDRPASQPAYRPAVEAVVKNYVLRRAECPFNCPDLNFHRAGERVFFFEDGDDFREVKSYELRDGSVALWMRIPKSDIFLVTFAFPPSGNAVYAHHAQAGLFLKQREDLPDSLGKEVAPSIPEACGNDQAFFLSATEERVLAGCASEKLSVFAWMPGQREWNNRSPSPSAWKDGKLKAHAVSGGLLFLAGEKKIHVFDPDLREIRPVGEQKELFGDTTYQPRLGATGGVPYAAAGDKFYFWDSKTRSFVNPFANASSSLRFWYDQYESDRVLLDGEKGEEAFIQVSDDTLANRGLGHFLKEEKGWTYRGLLEDVAMVQPVALAGNSLILGDAHGLFRREIGVKTCRPSKVSSFADSFSWIAEMVEGGTIRGKVIVSAPELCRIEIETPDGRIKRRAARVRLDPDSPFEANFERVKIDDVVVISVSRREGNSLVASRVFIERRDGAPVEGQAPWQNQPFALAMHALVFLLGGGTIFLALRRMSRAGEACLPRIFDTEEKVRAANRLRVVGLAVLALGWLGLTANLKGRPLDALGFLESAALQLGSFWVVFAVLYYVAAANLLKILRRTRPS